jgi:hypothetical protein
MLKICAKNPMQKLPKNPTKIQQKTLIDRQKSFAWTKTFAMI